MQALGDVQTSDLHNCWLELDELRPTLVSFKELGDVEFLRLVCAWLGSVQLSSSCGLGSGEVILSNTQNRGVSSDYCLSSNELISD